MLQLLLYEVHTGHLFIIYHALPLQRKEIADFHQSQIHKYNQKLKKCSLNHLKSMVILNHLGWKGVLTGRQITTLFPVKHYEEIRKKCGYRTLSLHPVKTTHSSPFVYDSTIHLERVSFVSIFEQLPGVLQGVGAVFCWEKVVKAFRQNSKTVKGQTLQWIHGLPA